MESGGEDWKSFKGEEVKAAAFLDKGEATCSLSSGITMGEEVFDDNCVVLGMVGVWNK